MTITELFALIANNASFEEIKPAIDDNVGVITMTTKTPGWSYKLLDQQSNPQNNCNVFLCAAEKGRQDILEYLLTVGFDAKSDLLSAAYMSLSVNQATAVFLLEQMTPESLLGARGILQMSVSEGYSEIVGWFAAHGISAEEPVEVVAAGDLAGHNDAIA